MNEAICLAIVKGGYDFKGVQDRHRYNWRFITAEDGGSMLQIQQDGVRKAYPLQVIAQDPQFWQALGKALGKQWVERNDYCHHWVVGVWWFETARRYFEIHLTAGDTKKFWNELLKSDGYER